MRISVVSGACLTLLLALACGRVELGRARPIQRHTDSGHAASKANEQALLVASIRAANARIDQELTPPAERGRSRCPDETILSGSAPTGTLILRTRDARPEARTPLPLRLVSALSSDEFSSIVPHFSGGAAALWDPDSAKPRTLEDAKPALEALTALAGRRYLAELRIETYSEPNLFRRKDAPRSEWNPGVVAGRLVVYDLSERRALCQAPVLARGDAEGAPIRRRLREQTRARLRDSLNDRTYSVLEGALSSITSRFVLPARVGEVKATERWAAAPENLARSERRFR